MGTVQEQQAIQVDRLLFLDRIVGTILDGFWSASSSALRTFSANGIPNLEMYPYGLFFSKSMTSSRVMCLAEATTTRANRVTAKNFMLLTLDKYKTTTPDRDIYNKFDLRY